MPSKSKKNRRDIPQNRNLNNPAVETAPMSVAQSSSSPKSEPVLTASRGNPRTTTQVQVYSNFGSELKWIAFVAGVVIILLITAYYLFR